MTPLDASAAQQTPQMCDKKKTPLKVVEALAYYFLNYQYFPIFLFLLFFLFPPTCPYLRHLSYFSLVSFFYSG